MQPRVLAIPYDTALRNFRMGSGPDRLLRADLTDSWEAAGHVVTVEHVGPAENPVPAEIRTAFELNRDLPRRVRAAAEAGAVPIRAPGSADEAERT